MLSIGLHPVDFNILSKSLRRNRNSAIGVQGLGAINLGQKVMCKKGNSLCGREAVMYKVSEFLWTSIAAMIRIYQIINSNNVKILRIVYIVEASSSSGTSPWPGEDDVLGSSR